MRKTIGFLTCFLCVIVPMAIYTQTMSDFCSVSPFLTRTVPPNIALVIDNSAAMLSPAYALTDHYDDSHPTSYVGYYDPQGMYCSTEDIFYASSGGCEPGDHGPYPGALLNWATMSRYDILMYVLAGGLGVAEPHSVDLAGESLNKGWTKTTPRYPQCQFTVSDDSLHITGTGCALENPGARIIVQDGRKERGLIAELIDRDNDGVRDTLAARIAVMNFQSLQNDAAITTCLNETDSLQDLFRSIARAVADEADRDVPLGKAVVRTIEFYKNVCPMCSTCTDLVDAVQCRKNFVIILSSGDATDIPSLYSPQHLNEEIRKVHTSDIRADRDGTQVIQYYSMNVFGAAAGRDIMKGFAQYGGFTDINGNGLPDLAYEWDRDGDGWPDTYFEASAPQSIWSSLRRAFSDISSKTSSGTATARLSGRTGSAGTLVRAFFVPSRREDGSEVSWAGYLENYWTDPARNLREDTAHDYKLVLNQDKIVQFFTQHGSDEPKAALFSTQSDGSGGTFGSCSSPEIRGSAEVKSIWEAGRSLAMKSPSERMIFTSKKIVRGERLIHTFSENPYPAFQPGMNSTLLAALNPDATYSAEAIVRYIRGECLESGVTGDNPCSSGINPAFRDRRVTIGGVSKVWKLGDIMNSTPKVLGGISLNAYHVDYADRSYYDYIADSQYQTRSSVVFAGANDGMLHAFRGGYLEDKGLTNGLKALLKNVFGSGDGEHELFGEEIWAYIPFNAFPYLKYLADPHYCHINFSDLSVKLFDASFGGGPAVTRDQNSWKTILLGGMRFGGACGTGGSPSDPPAGTPTDVGFSSYFALDLSVPERPVPLWEFSDDDLGFAASAPAIARIGDRMQNGTWYVVFGSGSKVLPKDGIDVGRNAPGYLYILNLATGDLVKKITLDEPAIVGDLLAIDADRDYKTEKIYFGTSFQSNPRWMGTMMSLNLPAVLESGGVDVAWHDSFGRVLFSGNYPFTASPETAKDLKGAVWVYAGSGKYFSDLDETDTSRQIVVGLRDENVPVSEASLFDATHVLTNGDVAGTDRVCGYDAATNSFRFRDIVTAVKPSSTLLTSTDPGWKISLSGGERVISRPVAVGGLLDFLSYKPDSDPCTYHGDSYLYSVSYTTGLAPARVAIRSPDITTGSSGSVTVRKSIRLGSGAPPSGDAITIQPPEDGSEQLRKDIQLGGGLVAEAENRPLFAIVSKIVHWLKK